MARIPSARAALLAVLVLAATLGCGRSADPYALRDDTPVVLVVVDTLTARHLSTYGYELETSPHLDAFAQNATVFEANTTQCNSTFPSITSIMTGLYVRTHKNLLAVPEVGTIAASSGERSLAERLADVGYHTLGVASHPSWTAEPKTDAVRRGWDEFSIIPANVSEPRALWANAGYTNERLFTLLDEYDETRDGPLFLWAHYFDPHTDLKLDLDLGALVYCPPPEFRDRFLGPHLAAIGQSDLKAGFSEREPELRPEWINSLPAEKKARLALANGNALYDAEIANTDHGLRQLFDRLDARGLLERALVVVMADHGENLSGRTHDDGGLDFTHRRLYEDVAHTPLIIKLPGQRVGQRVQALTQNIDVLPTVMELLNLAATPAVEGQSLVPLLRDPAARIHNEVYTESSDNVEKAVRSDDMKLVDSDGERPLELYRWRTDINELEDLAASEVAELRDERTRLATLIEHFRPKEILALHLAPAAQPYEVELEIELPRSKIKHAFDAAGAPTGTVSDAGRVFRWQGAVRDRAVDLRLFMKNRKPPTTWTIRKDGRAPGPETVYMGQVPVEGSVAIPTWSGAPSSSEPQWSVRTQPDAKTLTLFAAASERPRTIELRYAQPTYAKSFDVVTASGLASAQRDKGHRFVFAARSGEALAAQVAYTPGEDDLLVLFRDDGHWPAVSDAEVDGQTRASDALRFRWPLPNDQRLNALLLATPDLTARPPGSITIWRSGGGSVSFDRARMDPERASELEALGYLGHDD